MKMYTSLMMILEELIMTNKTFRYSDVNKMVELVDSTFIDMDTTTDQVTAKGVRDVFHLYVNNTFPPNEDIDVYDENRIKRLTGLIEIKIVELDLVNDSTIASDLWLNIIDVIAECFDSIYKS